MKRRYLYRRVLQFLLWGAIGLLVVGCTPSADTEITGETTGNRTTEVVLPTTILSTTEIASVTTTRSTVKTDSSTADKGEITTMSKTDMTIQTTQTTMETVTTIRPTFQGPQGQESLTNLTHNNRGGKMGDADGPAYCVYSQKGYNRASIDILLSEVDMNVVRKSDGELLTAYLFLGADIFDDNGNFVNCFDAGIGYHIYEKKWVLFFNILYVNVYQQKWYTSSVPLDETHDYRLKVDTSQQDGWALVMLEDLTLGGVQVDSAAFETLYSRKDGSNTLYLQDYAIDYPDRVKFDTAGQPSNDWAQITLYNTDQDIYLRNVRIVNATLNDEPWTAEKTRNRSVWPDCTMTWMDYPVVKVSHATFDTELQIDLDMNR